MHRRLAAAGTALVLLALAVACKGASGPATDVSSKAPPRPLAVPADHATEAEATEVEGPAGGGPVIVELFTSQGCSSCPPADQVLADLDALVPGIEVIGLAFHVDYWNDLGWTEPYSSPRWSARQRAYARRLPDGRVYTPQLVVGGRTHVVGSRRGEVAREIRAQAREPVIDVTLSAALTTQGRHRTMRVSVSMIFDGNRDARDLDVMVALVERTTRNPVPAGENAGRTLASTHVVRALERAFTIGPGDRTRRATIGLPLPAHLDPSGVEIVAFVQHAETLHIHAGAVLRPDA